MIPNWVIQRAIKCLLNDRVDMSIVHISDNIASDSQRFAMDNGGTTGCWCSQEGFYPYAFETITVCRGGELIAVFATLRDKMEK